MKRYLLLLFILSGTLAASARSWTFTCDGKVDTIKGTYSFKKGGRLDADYIRLDGTNVTLLLSLSGASASVPIAWLSKKDLEYLRQVRYQKVDEGKVQQDAEARLRLQKAIAANNERQKKLQSAAEAAKADQDREAKAAQRSAILARFACLLEGAPHPEIELIATSEVATYSATANQILMLAREISERKLIGSPLDVTQKQITMRLEQFIDLGLIK